MFQKFSKEVTKTSFKDITPYTYLMRKDGTLLFCTGILSEGGEPLFLGEPVRFPRIVEIDTLARREELFEMPYYCITKVCDEGSMENAQEIQQNEVNKIIEASNGELKGFNKRPYYGGAVFRLDELSRVFTCRKAYENAIDINNDKVIETTEWVTQSSGIDKSNLGMTGSGVFGIIDAEDEDVDMVYYESLECLLKIREEIRNGVKNGKFQSLIEYGKTWPLRIWLSKNVQQCPFFVLKDPKSNFMYQAEINVIKWHEKFEFTVADDSMNMISPIILETDSVSINDKSAPSYPLVINNTFYRGDFYKGQRLLSSKTADIEVKTKDGKIIKAYLIVEWNVVSELK